ncbi:MAG: cytochrome P460 family protein [Massilia sp.]
MRIVGAMRIAGALGVALAGLSMMVAVTAYGRADTRSSYKGAAAAIVDDQGNLRVPADYQTAYQGLGSWAVAEDKGQGSKEMHVVYASPGTIAAYRKGGHFPDGTVLVKEVFKTTTKPMTTGTVSSPGALVGWFVMVKDDVGRFPKNKLWGNGWGWSWFDAINLKKTTSTDFKKDCLSCHVPAQASDWIYVHGYPPLRG